MKKTLVILCAAILASSAYGFPARIVEFGDDISVGASNNYLGLGDIFKPTLVVDLGQLEKATAWNGASTGIYERGQRTRQRDGLVDEQGVDR